MYIGHKRRQDTFLLGTQKDILINNFTFQQQASPDDILQDQKSLTSVEEYKKCWTMYMQLTTYIR